MLKRLQSGAPMDWDKLRIFHAAAQAGSFTHAGDVLHMSQSAVSRQVAALEAELGVPLFHRHARGLILTEQGEELFRAAADVLLKLEAVRSRLTDSAEKPSGTLRVTTTVGLGSTWLTPRLHEFVELYPSINLHLILDDQELDLAMRQADVAIRLRQPTQPDLIQRRLFTVHMHLYAAPSYLKRMGHPKSIDELDGHRIVTFGGPVPSYLKDLNWLETAGRTSDNAREPAVKINNIFAMKNAVMRGMGIAMLPNYMVEADSGLVQLLPDEQVPSFASYFVYPAELKNSARVHVFRDFLLTKAQSWSY
jgi:DNA-binding transcriptional LysR family regulator